MRINDLQINGFGKLSDKKIKLDKNINIIYGKNEAGKSTLLHFIQSMFYGVSKNKNGKEISNYEKYTPWKTKEFSGRISCEFDNGEKYEIFRDFNKKNPVIYNSNKQDISLNYNIDKNKGIDFIYSEVNIDEEIFNNTILVEQDEIKVQKSAQNGIIQKISNIVSAGDENISYKKTIDQINKLQLEQIGTDRTREKPINIINDKLKYLNNSKEKIDRYKNFLKENNLSLQELQDKIDEEEVKLSLYRVIKESNDKSKLKNNEIQVIKDIRDECFNKIEELDEKIDKDSKEKIKKKKKSPVFIILLMVCLIIAIGLLFNENKNISFILVGISIFLSILEIILRIKFNKNKKIKLKEIDDLENKIEQEINILRNNIKSRQSEIDIKQEEIRQAENEVNRLVMNNFEDKLDSDFIEEAFELEYHEVENKISEKNDIINNLKIEKGAKQNQKESMLEEINDLSNIQEEIDELKEEKKELLSLNTSFNLAKEGLKNAYENVRNSLSPEFINRLCEIISKVSNEKYKDIKFIDTDGLIIQVENGRFFPVERLSQGTIDQMYLGLRLACIDTVSSENMPIFLDETFAFFDDDRLENILKFINENYNNKQIIIFTCSKRELNVLNNLSIDYNYVDLEK